ncbi:MAG: amidase [Chloroflexi bacterium]|nr:amidase [Chloroflexota bacterium]
MPQQNGHPTPFQSDESVELIELERIAQAARVMGLEFDENELTLMQARVSEHRADYERLRAISPENSAPPALHFDPIPASHPHPDRFFAADLFAERSRYPAPSSTAAPTRPDDIEALAFWPLSDLARLIAAREVSAVELTEMYLARLRRFDPLLKCVVTLTEELALEQARMADRELANGHYRGPLHGIPWGAKDLLAARGYPTTWGATPYREQVIDMDATVVTRLAEAGAVLAAKLTLGALAWGDVWFGGQTRTPWDPEKGSSGSSAGSAAAVAAGLVGFAIGSETYGSIVSPSTQCGTTGLRPTFGRVSRHGAMALSWSMDKLGPICRSVEDCAWVFAAIHGADGLDPTALDRPFSWPHEVRLADLRIGYVAADFEKTYRGCENDRAALQTLRDLGANLIPIELPDYPVDAMQLILEAEAAAAFDELTRSGRDDLLVRQTKDAWPNVFRAARLIPAVEYIQANRIRTRLMQDMARLMADIDLYLAPSLEGPNLLLTNLTGHPAVVLPNGFADDGLPTTITFIGRLFDEATLLAAAKIYQDATDFHRRRPKVQESERQRPETSRPTD